LEDCRHETCDHRQRQRRENDTERASDANACGSRAGYFAGGRGSRLLPVRALGFPPELRAILPPIAEAKFLEAGMPGVPLPDELLTDLKVWEADGPGDPVYDQVKGMKVAARRRLRYA